MTPLLEARDVAIGGRLQATDLEIGSSAMIALIGPNGGGKTSLLRALAAVEMDGGSVVVDGEDIASAAPARRPHLLTFLPASRDAVWPIRARAMIELGLANSDPQRVDRLLEELELVDLANRPINRLSTGERARVLLARALAPCPRILLLDEPLSNLDPYWVLRTLQLLRETVRKTRCSAIVSLHDIDRLQSFDRVLLASSGRIVADLPPDAMLASRELAHSFRIEMGEGGWRVSPPADRRSSP
ncbi:MAG TPA: ABC transporter ATP-binding protein [Sphingomicrobium sp.]|nr:ABC transporter ATP-binding protein [Sphingomicrobium sp.]